MKQKDVLFRFLNGTGKTPEGLCVSDVLTFSDMELENNHKYVQYLFPGRKKSLYNLKAPILTDAELKKILVDEACLENIRAGANKMISFWERKTTWQAMDHNFLRMTRCYSFLRECQMKEEMKRIIALMKHLTDLGCVTPKTMKVWKKNCDWT